MSDGGTEDIITPDGHTVAAASTVDHTGTNVSGVD